MRRAIATVLPDRRSGAVVRDGLATVGEPLDPHFRNQLEQGFGQDLGDVRVHTDGTAAESARRVGAGAFTVGPDVVFGAGRYRPGDAEGWRLLSHEIAHVLQQRGAPSRDGPPGRASESSERAARAAAEALFRGEPAPALESTDGLALARDALTIEDFDESETKASPATPAGDEDTDLIGQQKTPFSTQLSDIDPSVILVPIDATRGEIARELKVDVSRFYVIGAMEARPPEEDVQGIRFYNPADIPPALMTLIRARLDAHCRPTSRPPSTRSWPNPADGQQPSTCCAGRSTPATRTRTGAATSTGTSTSWHSARSRPPRTGWSPRQAVRVVHWTSCWPRPAATSTPRCCGLAAGPVGPSPAT